MAALVNPLSDPILGRHDERSNCGNLVLACAAALGLLFCQGNSIPQLKNGRRGGLLISSVPDKGYSANMAPPAPTTVAVAASTGQP